MAATSSALSEIRRKGGTESATLLLNPVGESEAVRNPRPAKVASWLSMFDDLPTNLGHQIQLTVAKEIQVYLAGRYEIIKIVHFSELFPTRINVGNCRTAGDPLTFRPPTGRDTSYFCVAEASSCFAEPSNTWLITRATECLKVMKMKKRRKARLGPRTLQP